MNNNFMQYSPIRNEEYKNFNDKQRIIGYNNENNYKIIKKNKVKIYGKRLIKKMQD